MTKAAFYLVVRIRLQILPFSTTRGSRGAGRQAGAQGGEVTASSGRTQVQAVRRKQQQIHRK